MRINIEDSRLECECNGDSHYFPHEWDDEWSDLSSSGTGFIVLKDCPLIKNYRVIKESEHFILGYIL